MDVFVPCPVTQTLEMECIADRVVKAKMHGCLQAAETIGKNKNTFYGSSTHGVFQLGPCFYGLAISRDQVRSHVEQAVAMEWIMSVMSLQDAQQHLSSRRLLSNHR